MGQQQILFLVLGACIVGVALCAVVIDLQADSASDCRVAMVRDLRRFAEQAHLYRARSFEEGGGDGTFIGLTATTQGIEKLRIPRIAPYAEYFIRNSGNETRVEFAALGYSRGSDVKKPIKMLMTVFADSLSLHVLN